MSERAGERGLRTVRMTLQYDGTRYRGWQTQPGGGTVQDEVEARLSQILDHPIRVHGAGRTDAGVHARGQEASFETRNPLPVDRLFRGLNALLPDDIAAIRWREAPPGFHARHSARSRAYVYQIWREPVCSPFARRFVHHLHRPLDRQPMQRAAAAVVGRHDFTSFCAAESAAALESRERLVTRSRWIQEGELLVYRVEAEGFLHNMVRILVGTMLEIGGGAREPGAMASILAARDRRAAGPTVPARGLFLERVSYREDDDVPEGGG